MFTILSIGDSAFLEQILIALAMVSGTGDFEQAVSIGLLVSALIVVFASIIKPSEGAQFQYVLITWLIYMIAFYPKVTVTIEDGYSGEVRPVANVPAGIAFAGSSFSKIGYGLTVLFETGYTVIVPYVTDTPSLDPLKSMTALFRNADSPFLFHEMSKVAGSDADLKQSMVNYLKDCTMMKVQQGSATPDQVERDAIEDGLFFDNGIFATELYLGGAPLNLTCADAFPQLRNAISLGMDSPGFADALKVELGKGDDPLFDPLVELQGYQNMLTGASLSGKQVIETFLFDKLYDQAAKSHYEDMLDTNMALQYNDAIVQRNLQWAAEGSMFKTIVRPLVTFLEGFFYGISPFIMFIIAVAGAKGIMLAVKFLLIGIWIQLWAPITALINLYLFMSASGEMSSLVTANVDINSMYAIDHIAHRAQHWIGVGGMLASAVPVLALAVIYGGAVSMGNLAGRFKAADHFDESAVVPKALDRGSYANAEGVLSLHQGTGTSFNKGEEGSISHSASQALKSGISSQQQTVSGARKSVDQAVSNAYNKGLTHTEQQDYMHSLGRRMASSNSQTYQAAQDFVSKISQGQDWSSEEKHLMASNIAAQTAIQGSAGFKNGSKKLVGLQAAINGSLSAGGQVSDMEVDSFSEKYSTDLDKVSKTSKAEQVSLTSEKAAAWQETFKSADTGSEARQYGRSISEANSRYEEEKEQLSHMQERSSQTNMQATYTGHNLVGRAGDYLKQQAKSLTDGNTSLNDEYSRMVRNGLENGQNTKTAEALAAYQLITNRQSYNSAEEHADAVAGIDKKLMNYSDVQATQQPVKQEGMTGNVDPRYGDNNGVLRDQPSRAEAENKIKKQHENSLKNITDKTPPPSRLPEADPNKIPVGKRHAEYDGDDVGYVFDATGSRVVQTADKAVDKIMELGQGMLDGGTDRNAPKPVATLEDSRAHTIENRVTDSSDVPMPDGSQRPGQQNSGLVGQTLHGDGQGSMPGSAGATDSNVGDSLQTSGMPAPTLPGGEQRSVPGNTGTTDSNVGDSLQTSGMPAPTLPGGEQHGVPGNTGATDSNVGDSLQTGGLPGSQYQHGGGQDRVPGNAGTTDSNVGDSLQTSGMPAPTLPGGEQRGVPGNTGATDSNVGDSLQTSGMPAPTLPGGEQHGVPGNTGATDSNVGDSLQTSGMPAPTLPGGEQRGVPGNTGATDSNVGDSLQTGGLPGSQYQHGGGQDRVPGNAGTTDDDMKGVLQDWSSRSEVQQTIESGHENNHQDMIGGAPPPSPLPEAESNKVVQTDGNAAGTVEEHGQGMLDGISARNPRNHFPTFEETQAHTDENRVTDSSEVPMPSGSHRSPGRLINTED